MDFEPEEIYHVYNRGNNRQQIFYTEENYAFFLRKVKRELTVYCDILAYCLMPNHFHFLVYANKASVGSAAPGALAGQTAVTSVLNNETPTPRGQTGKLQPLVRKIGTLLSSYTQAINKQEGRSGSLFQSKTKAKVLSEDQQEEDYPFICFNYIHQNPLKAGLVDKMEDWKFSSFKEYLMDIRGICHKERARALLNLPNDKQEFYNTSYDVIEPKYTKNLFN